MRSGTNSNILANSNGLDRWIDKMHVNCFDFNCPFRRDTILKRNDSFLCKMLSHSQIAVFVRHSDPTILSHGFFAEYHVFQFGITGFSIYRSVAETFDCKQAIGLVFVHIVFVICYTRFERLQIARLRVTIHNCIVRFGVINCRIR